MPATPGQAANTRGAYPLTTPQAPPWPSLQPVSPAGAFTPPTLPASTPKAGSRCFPLLAGEGQGVANHPRGPATPAPSRATREGEGKEGNRNAT